MINFGDNIKELRKAAGMTQSDIAFALNVHLQTVSKWERGISEPDFSVLGELADVLGVSLEKLLGTEEAADGAHAGAFDAAAFGRAVTAERRRLGVSQSELADSLGVSQNMISNWERGVTAPSAGDLVALAARLGVSVSRLYYAAAAEPPCKQDTSAACALQTERHTEGRTLRRTAFIAVVSAALLACVLVLVLILVLSGSADSGAPAPATEYTVTFIADGKTVGTDTYTAEDKVITEPAVPEKAGYTGEWERCNLSLGDITVNAVYTKLVEKYMVEMSHNEFAGEIGRYYSGEYEEGTDLQLSAFPFAGYEFTGWYDEGEFISDNAECTFTVPAHDVSLKARFAIRADMEDYEFNSGSDWCEITGIKFYLSGEVMIPDCVTSIGDSVFRNYFGLTSINIPESVTSIEEGAFALCDSLASITFSDPYGWTCGGEAVSADVLSDPVAAAEFMLSHPMNWIKA